MSKNLPIFFKSNLTADCLHFQLFVYFFCQLFVYFFVSWLFTFVSCLFTFWILNFPPVFCQNNASSCLFTFVSCFVYIFSYLFTISAVCLLFVSWLFTFSAVCLHFQLLVYIFSCLFTFSAVCLLLSADFSCLFTSCQLIFEFLRKNHVFLVTFLPLQMLQHFNCKLKKFYLDNVLASNGSTRLDVPPTYRPETKKTKHN